MNKMHKKSLKFLNTPWIIGIAIIVSIIILPYPAIPKWHSGPRPLKADGRNAVNTLLLSQDFESLDDITAAGGSYGGVNLVPGKSGKGVKIDSSAAFLSYPTDGHFNIQKGTIEFWLAPLFDMYQPPSDTSGQVIFQFQWSANQNLAIILWKSTVGAGKQAGWALSIYFNHGKPDQKRYVGSLEPRQLSMCRPNVFSRIRLFWDLSLPGKTSYILLQVNDVYRPLVSCAPITPDTIMPGATMYLGNRSSKGQPAHAIFDSLRVWDTPLIPVSPFPQYFFNPAVPATIATFDALYANDGICSAHETHATQPADCPILAAGIAPGQNVVAFERPAFEWVLPNYVPVESEIKSTFAYKAPLGEYETVFFNIYSRIALSNMALNYTALTGPGTIAKSNLDLRVVYNWWQSSLDTGTVAEPLPVYAPELMLHSDIWDRVKQINPQLDPTIGQFKIPTLLRQDHVDTAMSAYTSKQFGLIIYIPPETTPGNYTGMVTITATQLSTPLIININFTVLPFALRDSGSIAMPWLSMDDIWYYAQSSRMKMDAWDIYKKTMQEMVKYGIYGVQHGCVNDYDNGHTNQTQYGNARVYGKISYLPYLKKKIQLSREAGMKMVCMYAGCREDTLHNEYTVDLVNLMKSYGYEPWLMGQDEFADAGSATWIYQCTKSKRIKEIGGKSFTNTVYAKTIAMDRGYTLTVPPYTVYTPEQTTLDGASYIIGDFHLQDMQGKRSAKLNKYETYYFQTRSLVANYERHWCGYFRYLTACNGPQPTWFVAFPSGWRDYPGRYSNYGVVYPAVDQKHKFQLIPTLHGCAMREGFKDDKYLATWKYYRDRVAAAHPMEVAASQTVINAILAHYREEFACAVNGGLRNSLAQFAADRTTIINEILTLKKLPAVEGG
jgi:hypothetical protein